MMMRNRTIATATTVTVAVGSATIPTAQAQGNQASSEIAEMSSALNPLSTSISESDLLNPILTPIAELSSAVFTDDVKRTLYHLMTGLIFLIPWGSGS